MLGLRHLPLKYRLPLIHGALTLLGKVRSGGWTTAGAAERPHPGDFVVSGFFNESSGIGRGGQLTAQAIRTAGYDIIEHDLRPCFKQILGQKAVLPGTGGVWFIHANAPEVLVALLAHDPASWLDRYRIGYWAWETPKAPADWLFVADYLHEIWVPSRFVRDALATAFSAGGRDDLIVRIRIMPHPVPAMSAQTLLHRDQARQKFGLQTGVCEVLCLFDTKSSAVRKNPWGVTDAWLAAFPEPVATARLTCKVSDLSGDRAAEQRLLALAGERDDIRLVQDRFDDRDMAAFISAFDILISLHRSEGFGLPLAEAMTAGVAVIATDWSGNTDFMHADNSWLVAAGMTPVHDPEGPYSGLESDLEQIWAEPELDAATRALLELTASPEMRHALAAHARVSIKTLDIPWQQAALVALPFNRFI